MVIAFETAVPPAACALVAMLTSFAFVRSIYHAIAFDSRYAHRFSQGNSTKSCWSIMLQGILGKLYAMSFFVMLYVLTLCRYVIAGSWYPRYRSNRATLSESSSQTLTHFPTLTGLDFTTLTRHTDANSSHGSFDAEKRRSVSVHIFPLFLLPNNADVFA